MWHVGKYASLCEFELLYQDNLKRDISTFVELKFHKFLEQQMLANKKMMEASIKENRKNGVNSQFLIGAIIAMSLCFIGGCFIWTQYRIKQ